MNERKPQHIDEVAIQKLWDKIKATFAEREDVLKLCIQLERIERVLCAKDKTSITGIISGESDKIIRPNRLGLANISYEKWIESDSTDSAGKPTKLYNESQNAVSAAAAAAIVKSLRKDMANRALIQLVFDVDKEGMPVVPQVDYNTIYLTPRENSKFGSHWEEWIAVPVRPGMPRKHKPYTWEHLGDKEVDLSGICNDIESINAELVNLNKRIHKHSAKLVDAMLEKAIKPLDDLKAYINSPEYIQYVFENLPKAGIGQDGLMTSGMVAVLSNLAVWAGNDHKVPGGGAIGSDTVIHLFQKAGVPTDKLKKSFHHGCPDCIDELI